MAITPFPDYDELFDPDALGTRAQVPSAGNAWGAIVAPTLDPTKRPDVLNPDGSRSSLISSSDRVRSADGTPIGEMLYPQVTDDGREIGPDAGYDLAKSTGKHLGIYSSVPMADQAAIAMHNAGAEQMQSPSFRPTGWFRADKPGFKYASQADRDAGVSPIPVGPRAPIDPAVAAYVMKQPPPTAPAKDMLPPPADNSGLRVLAAALEGAAGRPYSAGYWQGLDRDRVNRFLQNRQLQEQEAQKRLVRDQQDPNSQVSIRKRALLAPYLRASGLSDEDMGKLSASDLAGADLGDLVRFSAAQKQRLNDAQAASQAELDKEARENAEWERRHQIELTGKEDFAKFNKGLKGSGTGAGTGVGFDWDAEQSKLANVYGGEVPPAIQAQFDSIRSMPVKQRGGKLEQFWGSIQTRGDKAKPKVNDDMISAWERANPGFIISDPEVYSKAMQDSRATSKYRTDLQDAHTLRGAAQDLIRLRREYSKTPLYDVPKLTQITASYNTAAEKAVGAQARLSGGSTESDRQKIADHIPSIMNPLAEDKLKGQNSVFEEVINNRMRGTYGISLGSRPKTGGTDKVTVRFADGTKHLATPAQLDAMKRDGVAFEVL